MKWINGFNHVRYNNMFNDENIAWFIQISVSDYYVKDNIWTHDNIHPSCTSNLHKY